MCSQSPCICSFAVCGEPVLVRWDVFLSYNAPLGFDATYEERPVKFDQVGE
jgi:hypothetical protein